MMFWSTALQAAAKLESLRAAEKKLLEFAHNFAVHSKESYEIEAFDTLIPRSSVPLKPLSSSSWSFSSTKTEAENSDEDTLTMHSIHVRAKQNKAFDDENTSDTPLVIVHGYMNAAAYFYRNLTGLAHYFKDVYSLDLLGFGLSSRPDFSQLKDNSVDTAEDFFVESLEQWRQAQKLPKMILAGHSLGGYLSVAYTERYPEHVERLVLLSPVGVPDEEENNQQQKQWQERMNSSYRTRAMVGVFRTMFKTTTPGSVLRTLSESRARGMIEGYVERRLPEISDPAEQAAVSDYLYKSAVLPGSAEYCISKFLDPTILARKPLRNRIPLLKVPHVNFLYGSTDWMPVSAALSTQRLCEQSSAAPTTNVYVVRDSGHLLMLQNWDGFNAGVVHASGGKVPYGRLPIHMREPEEEEDCFTIGARSGTKEVAEKLLQEERDAQPEIAVN